MTNNLLRWLMPFREMDYEQQNAVNNTLKPGTSFVYGPAGSGKTAIALYCAKVLQDLGKSYRVFIYTNVLDHFISAGARELGLAPQSITTFYRWVWWQHKEQLGSPPNNGGAEKYSIWTDALIRHWSTNPSRKPKFDYVIIDEAQDFRANVAKLLHMVAPNLLVVADPVQSIYVDVASLADLNTRWGPINHQLEVPRNYRNPMAVAKLAAAFVDGYGVSAGDFLKRVKGKPFDQKPLWYSVNSLSEQSRVECEIIQQARGSVRIGILCRHQDQIHDERARLQGMGVEVQIALGTDGYDFNNPLPVLTTIHSAKGLEFDWVILPYLNEESWADAATDPKERRVFFVALTRAKERLYLISQTGHECSFLKEILAKDRDLLQQPRPSSTPKTPQVNTYDYDSPF